jgi:ankyrin repeat protein
MLGTPLYTAIKEKTMKTPDKTLDLINADNEIINSKGESNETYLHFISDEYSGDEDAPALIPVIFQLSNAGMDVNATDTSGNTALHVAAQRDKTRKLIRALLMVGVDPLIKNAEKKTPLKLAKPFPENLKILNFMSPGLWNAVERNSEERVKTLTSNWCKVNEKRNQITMLALAEKIGNVEIRKMLAKIENTNAFVHYALAGDRKKMRPFFKIRNVSVDTFSSSYIDEVSGDYVSLPLVGEVALLGLTNVVRKLLRKKASLIFSVLKTPMYLYVMQHIKPIEEFYEMLEILLDKVDFIRNKSDTNTVLDVAYDKNLPISVLRTMTTKGLDLFLADDDGHFLRDRILLKNATETSKTIEKEIAYVDKIVIDMASNGCIGLLQG